MKRYFKTLIVTTICTSSIGHADEAGWFVRPNIGVSNLSDLSVTANDINGFNGTSEVSLDSGIVAGLGVGYQYNENLAVEVAWEYRSNDSAVSLPGGALFGDGNYASNTFFLNGHYYFDSSSAFKPYFGAGLAWIQEIDIDLEGQPQELSYSADGDVGLQVFGGVTYAFSDRFSLQAELRYTQVSGIELEPEEGASGRFLDVDYKPATLQLAALYRF